MNMDEFAEVVKKSNIAGNNKVEIIRELLKLVGKDVTSDSPSKSTIQKWLSGSKPRVKSYFPDLKMGNREKAHNFFKNHATADQWIKLRGLFEEWHNNNKTDKNFYINTETDDLITFSTSFWRQFASFFCSLVLWDDEEEEKESQIGIGNKMITIFKENFSKYEIYNFVPERIEDIISSLGIYRTILDETNELQEQEKQPEEGRNSELSTMQKLKKMYCKCLPGNNCFTFYAVDNYESVFKLRTEEKCILLRFGEEFNFDELPTNVWLHGRLQYNKDSQNILGKPFDERKLSWRECQGQIIIIETDFDRDDPIIKDCYTFIDEMLELDSLVDEFTTIIDEKIVKKFENFNFDNILRLLYNNIKQYIESLKMFKEYLTKFRGLEKEKSDYCSAREFAEQFGIYLNFDDTVPPKPEYPFSECYLNPSEAGAVKLKLCHYHDYLIELYAEILRCEKD